MEQAAKNLKLMNNEHLHNVMQAPTRNSNLQSQPNKDKLQKQNYNVHVSNSYGASGASGSHNQQPERQAVVVNKANHKSNKPQQAMMNQDDVSKKTQNNNFVTANGQVSVEQLKELMKNPQIARFLKE